MKLLQLHSENYMKLLQVHSNNYMRLLQAHSNNYTKLLQVHSYNDKIVKYQIVQRTLPTHRILQEDRSAFNCARFIEIRLVIHESLKVAVVAFKVPTCCQVVFANEIIATSSNRYFKVVTTNVFFRFFYIVHADKGFVVSSSDLSFSCKKWIFFSAFLLVPAYWQYLYCNLHNLMIEGDQLNTSQCHKPIEV